MLRILAFAVALALVAAGVLAGCQAFWDLPRQMRDAYGGSGSPLPPVEDRSIQNQDEEESLP